MLFPRPVQLLFLLSVGLLADPDRIEVERVSQLRIELADEKVVFNVSMRTLQREQIEERKVGDTFEAWLDGNQLPVETLWLKPSLITSFSLEIDGKEVAIPSRFWNDISGLYLNRVELVADDPTPEDLNQFEEAYSSPRLRPQVSRSAQGGTVLITWARPEE